MKGSFTCLLGVVSIIYYATAVHGLVLVVGATGGTGFRAIQGLLECGPYQPSDLLILTRQPSKPVAQSLQHKLGCQLLKGDLNDLESTVTHDDDLCQQVTGCYVHSTASDTMLRDVGEEKRAGRLAQWLASRLSQLECVVFNSAAGEPGHDVPRIQQKHDAETHFERHLGSAIRFVSLRANLFMEELWKDISGRPAVLNKGVFSFALPPDRKLYLTSVRDMGHVAGLVMNDKQQIAQRINVAGDHLTCVDIAAAYAAAQGTPCVHQRAPVLEWLARIVSPNDLYKIIRFYQLSTETTDIDHLQREFGRDAITSFADFLAETQWGDRRRNFASLQDVESLMGSSSRRV